MKAVFWGIIAALIAIGIMFSVSNALKLIGIDLGFWNILVGVVLGWAIGKLVGNVVGGRK